MWNMQKSTPVSLHTDLITWYGHVLWRKGQRNDDLFLQLLIISVMGTAMLIYGYDLCFCCYAVKVLFDVVTEYHACVVGEFCTSSRDIMWQRVKSSIDLPLRYTVMYDGKVFTRSSPWDMLLLIHPVKKASQLWFSVMERLVNDSSSFGMGNLV